MVGISDFLEALNETVMLPISILIFLVLIYIITFLWTRNPDIIRSRIFLNFQNFKNAFLLFVIFAFVLVIHIALIYQPHLFYFIFQCSSPQAEDLQRFFGLILALIMMTFVYLIFKSIK